MLRKARGCKHIRCCFDARSCAINTMCFHRLKCELISINHDSAAFVQR